MSDKHPPNILVTCLFSQCHNFCLISPLDLLDVDLIPDAKLDDHGAFGQGLLLIGKVQQKYF